jgi:hypothetical protein
MKVFITLIPGSFGCFSQNAFSLSTCIETIPCVVDELPEYYFDLTNNPNKHTDNPWPRARSLSVGDIVLVTIEEKGMAQQSKAWICQGIGWKVASASDVGERMMFSGSAETRFAKFRS